MRTLKLQWTTAHGAAQCGLCHAHTFGTLNTEGVSASRDMDGGCGIKADGTCVILIIIAMLRGIVHMFINAWWGNRFVCTSTAVPAQYTPQSHRSHIPCCKKSSARSRASLLPSSSTSCSSAPLVLAPPNTLTRSWRYRRYNCCLSDTSTAVIAAIRRRYDARESMDDARRSWGVLCRGDDSSLEASMSSRTTWPVPRPTRRINDVLSM